MTFHGTDLLQTQICDLGSPGHGSRQTSPGTSVRGSERHASTQPIPLSDRWRVDDDGDQWILHRLDGRKWKPLSYCRTKAALLRCIREYCAGVDIASIEGLPEYHASMSAPAIAEPEHNDKITELKAKGLIGQIWPARRSDPSPAVYGLVVPRRFAVEEAGIADAELKRLLQANDIADYGQQREAALIKESKLRGAR